MNNYTKDDNVIYKKFKFLSDFKIKNNSIFSIFIEIEIGEDNKEANILDDFL